MISRTTPKFWRMFDELPDQVQEHARKAFKIWRADPTHPSLHFKLVNKTGPLYSVRIDLRHRAVGVLKHDRSRGFGSVLMMPTTEFSTGSHHLLYCTNGLLVAT